MRIVSAMDRHEYEQLRRDNEARDAQIIALRNTPPPDDANDIGALLDHQFALHQGRSRGWDYPVFTPTQIDKSLSREDWDKEVQRAMGNMNKESIGRDAITGAYSVHSRALGDGAMGKTKFMRRLQEHYGNHD